MKPYQLAVLELLRDEPYSPNDLYYQFKDSDARCKNEDTRIAQWIKRNVRPLEKKRMIKLSATGYSITESGIDCLDTVVNGKVIVDEPEVTNNAFTDGDDKVIPSWGIDGY